MKMRRRSLRILALVCATMFLVGGSMGVFAASPPGVTFSTEKVTDVTCSTCTDADSIVLLEDGVVGLASEVQLGLETLSYHLNSVTLAPGQAMVGYAYDQLTQTYMSFSARTDTEHISVESVVVAVISSYGDPALTDNHPFLKDHKPMLVADVTTIHMSCAAGETVGSTSSSVMTTYPFDGMPPTSFTSEFTLTCMGS